MTKNITIRDTIILVIRKTRLLMQHVLEVLEFREAQQFRSGSNSVGVPVKVVANRVNCALDVHLRHGGHHAAKLEFASVTCLKSTLITFAHLVLLSCVHKIRIYEEHEQCESRLRNETAVTIRDEDETRVYTRKFSKRELERRSATAWLIQAQQTFSTVLSPSRLDLAKQKFEMQQLWDFTSATETWIPVPNRSLVWTMRHQLQIKRLHDAVEQLE